MKYNLSILIFLLLTTTAFGNAVPLARGKKISLKPQDPLFTCASAGNEHPTALLMSFWFKPVTDDSTTFFTLREEPNYYVEREIIYSIFTEDENLYFGFMGTNILLANTALSLFKRFEFSLISVLVEIDVSTQYQETISVTLYHDAVQFAELLNYPIGSEGKQMLVELPPDTAPSTLPDRPGKMLCIGDMYRNAKSAYSLDEFSLIGSATPFSNIGSTLDLVKNSQITGIAGLLAHWTFDLWPLQFENYVSPVVEPVPGFVFVFPSEELYAGNAYQISDSDCLSYDTAKTEFDVQLTVLPQKRYNFLVCPNEDCDTTITFSHIDGILLIDEKGNTNYTLSSSEVTIDITNNPKGEFSLLPSLIPNGELSIESGALTFTVSFTEKTCPKFDDLIVRVPESGTVRIPLFSYGKNSRQFELMLDELDYSFLTLTVHPPFPSGNIGKLCQSKDRVGQTISEPDWEDCFTGDDDILVKNEDYYVYFEIASDFIPSTKDFSFTFTYQSHLCSQKIPVVLDFYFIPRLFPLPANPEIKRQYDLKLVDYIPGLIEDAPMYVSLPEHGTIFVKNGESYVELQKQHNLYYSYEYPIRAKATSFYGQENLPSDGSLTDDKSPVLVEDPDYHQSDNDNGRFKNSLKKIVDCEEDETTCLNIFNCAGVNLDHSPCKIPGNNEGYFRSFGPHTISWRSKEMNVADVVEILLPTPIRVISISCFQNWFGGTIFQVTQYVRDEKGTMRWNLLLKRPTYLETKNTSIFTVNVVELAQLYETKLIRLYFKATAGVYNNLDSVLIGGISIASFSLINSHELYYVPDDDYSGPDTFYIGSNADSVYSDKLAPLDHSKTTFNVVVPNVEPKAESDNLFAVFTDDDKTFEFQFTGSDAETTQANLIVVFDSTSVIHGRIQTKDGTIYTSAENRIPLLTTLVYVCDCSNVSGKEVIDFKVVDEAAQEATATLTITFACPAPTEITPIITNAVVPLVVLVGMTVVGVWLML